MFAVFPPSDGQEPKLFPLEGYAVRVPLKRGRKLPGSPKSPAFFF